MRNRFGIYNKQLFSSQKEYDDYCWCLSKIELGDIVSIYINEVNGYISMHKTNRVMDVVVIAINKSWLKQLVIGSKKECLSFWYFDNHLHNYHFDGKDCIKDIKDYHNAWAVRTVADARIAKIRKNNIDG
jgi:hypothetical protein